MIGIYKIINPKGRIYIGQTRNFIKRLYDYNNFKHAIKKQKRLFASFNKYGRELHIIEMIEECKFEELNIRERYWQDYYDVLSKKGLNCVLVETNLLPRVYDSEIIEHYRKINLGENNPMYGIKGSKNVKSKPVINIETGEIWESLTQCCIDNNLNPKYMSRWLNGRRHNKTNFKYLKNE